MTIERVYRDIKAGRLDEAFAIANQVWQRVVGRRAQDLFDFQEGQLFDVLGGAYQKQGNSEEALKQYGRAINVYKRAQNFSSSRAQLDGSLSAVCESMGDILARQEDFPEAIDAYKDALGWTDVRNGLSINAATLLSKWGGMLEASGDVAGACAKYEEALGIIDTRIASNGRADVCERPWKAKLEGDLKRLDLDAAPVSSVAVGGGQA